MFFFRLRCRENFRVLIHCRRVNDIIANSVSVDSSRLAGSDVKTWPVLPLHSLIS